MEPWTLRMERRAQRLTLRQVARAAGTSETNVSAYERGAKPMRPSTVDRLRAVIAVGASSPIHRHTLMTVPATAAALRAGLRGGWSTSDLLRLVREMRSNSREISTDVDWAAFEAEPTTTGDMRWDALLAAAVEDLALRDSRRAPAWSRGHALDRVWFVGSLRGMDAYSFAYSPMSMQVRGIAIDPAELEAV